MSAVRRVTVLWLAISAVGCTGPAAEDTSGLPVTDVVIVGDVVLSASPDFVVGTSDDDPLHIVMSGLFGPQDRLLIAHEGAQAIAEYDGAGSAIRTIGRAGEGPGEFSRPRSLHAVSLDSFGVWDNALQRFTVFDSTGTVATTTSFAAQPGSPGRTLDLYSLGSDAFYSTSGNLTEGQGQAGLSRASHRIAVLDRTGARTAGGQRVAGSESYSDEGWGLPPLFTHKFLVATADDHAYIGSGRGVSVVEYDRTATAVRRLHLPLVRHPISRSEYEQVRENFLTRVPAPNRDRYRNMLDAVAPDSFPGYTVLVGSATGKLWVKRFALPDSATEWLVFDPRTATAWKTTLPYGAIVLTATDDRVAILVRDEFDREIVRVHVIRFNRRP